METPLIDRVKKELERTYKYDFDSEFWTDETITVLNETVEATFKVLVKDFLKTI